MSDFTDQFNTPLSKDEESQFARWMNQQSANLGRNLWMDLQDYDSRGYWKSSVKGKTAEQLKKGAHGPDTFKKPNHPTFSSESVYSTQSTPGGLWSKESGRSGYTPSDYVLGQRGALNTMNYFQQREPQEQLRILPTPPTYIPPFNRMIPPQQYGGRF